MADQHPYWYRVLKHYEKNSYYSNGLTIPFLIGARTIMEHDSDLQTTEELLFDLRESDHSVTIMKCGNINEFVIGLLDYETKSMLEKYKNLYKGFGSIIITDGSFTGVVDFNVFTSELAAIYDRKVQSKTFSKEAGQWGNFSATDITRLNEINESKGL